MKKTIFVFLGIGFLVYIQSLFNGFVMDDLVQILENSILYGFDKVPRIFIYFWGDYYKPLFYVVLNFLLTTFGNNPFPFHLTQLIVHISNSILVFLLFSKFFKKNISLILSLVFLVHPAISESVLYISAIQDVLYPFFGLLALNIAIYFKSPRSTFLVFIFLISSLLSKETGIAFFALVILYKLLFNRADIKKYLFYSVIILFLYIFIRFEILHINPFESSFKPVLTYDADFKTRLLTMPKIISKYLTIFVWPEKLQVVQLWWVRQINFSEFYLPLGIVTIFFGTIFAYATRAYYELKNESFPLFFFLAIILIGFLLHIQIIALDMTFAERWFVLPLIGLLGILGFILSRTEPNIRRIKILYSASVVIILLLSIRTFIRSFDYFDIKSLYLHDFEVDKQNPGTYYMLADYYMGEKNYEKAAVIYHQIQKITPENENLDSPLAFIELFKGNTQRAEEILEKSPKKLLPNRLNYAYILLRSDPEKGKILLLDSLNYFPENYEIYSLLGLTEYKLGNNNEAIKYFKKAAELNPVSAGGYNKLIDSILDGRPININYNLPL